MNKSIKEKGGPITIIKNDPAIHQAYDPSVRGINIYSTEQMRAEVGTKREQKSTLPKGVRVAPPKNQMYKLDTPIQNMN